MPHTDRPIMADSMETVIIQHPSSAFPHRFRRNRTSRVADAGLNCWNYCHFPPHCVDENQQNAPHHYRCCGNQTNQQLYVVTRKAVNVNVKTSSLCRDENMTAKRRDYCDSVLASKYKEETRCLCKRRRGLGGGVSDFSRRRHNCPISPLWTTNLCYALFFYVICFILINIMDNRRLPMFPQTNNGFVAAQHQSQPNHNSYYPYYHHTNKHHNKLQPNYHQYANSNGNHHEPRASESNAMVELNFGDLFPAKNAAAPLQPKSLKNNSIMPDKQQPTQLITYSELDYDMIPSSLAAIKPHPTINVKRDAQQQQYQQQQNDNFRIMTPPQQNYYNSSSFSTDFNLNSDFFAAPPSFAEQQPPPVDNSQWSQTYYFTPSQEPPTTSTLSHSTIFDQQQPEQPAQLLYRHHNNAPHNGVNNNGNNNKHRQQLTPRARDSSVVNFVPPPPSSSSTASTVPDSYETNHMYHTHDANDWQIIQPPQQNGMTNGGGKYDEQSQSASFPTSIYAVQPPVNAPPATARNNNNHNKLHKQQNSHHPQQHHRPHIPQSQRPPPYDEIVVDNINDPSHMQQPISPQSFLPPNPSEIDVQQPPFFGPVSTNFRQTAPTELPLTCPINSTQYLPTIVDACSVNSRGLHPPGRMVSADEAEKMITHETNITCDGGISVASLKWVFACIAAVPRHRVRLAIVGMRDAFVTFDSILPHGVAAKPHDYRNIRELRLEQVYGLILPARLLDFFPNLEKFVLRGIDLGQTLPSNAFLQQPPFFANKIHPLAELVIEHCKVEKIASDALLFLDQLRKITISNNNLVDLPFAAMEKMQNLQELDLSNNQLSLPPYQRVERLPPELRQLNLSGNLFADFPYRVVRQSGGKLQWLDVSRNRITFLKAKQLREDDRMQIIGKTKYLTHVDMSRNQVNLIGYPFTALFPAMTHFNMSSNSVPFVGPLLFSDQSQTLTNLDLSFNRISYIYQGLENLTNLQTLNLSTNRIDRMVSGSLAGARDSLQSLHLDNNHLTRLPSAVSELNNLERLDLRGNRMVKFEPSELTSSDTTLEMLALPRSIEIRNVGQFDRFERLRALEIPNANLVCNEHFLCRMIYELQGEHPAYCYVPPDHLLHNRTNKGWMRVNDFVNNSTFPCPSRDQLLAATAGGGADGGGDNDGTGASIRATTNVTIMMIAMIGLLMLNVTTTSALWAHCQNEAEQQLFQTPSTRRPLTAMVQLLEIPRQNNEQINSSKHYKNGVERQQHHNTKSRWKILFASIHHPPQRWQQNWLAAKITIVYLLYLTRNISQIVTLVEQNQHPNCQKIEKRRRRETIMKNRNFASSPRTDENGYYSFS